MTSPFVDYEEIELYIECPCGWSGYEGELRIDGTCPDCGHRF